MKFDNKSPQCFLNNLREASLLVDLALCFLLLLFSLAAILALLIALSLHLYL
jgi:hypothetical protein